MNKNRLIIFVLVGVMVFSAVALSVSLLVADSTKNDAQNTTEDLALCDVSDDIANQPGNPVGDWPATVEPTEELQIIDLREGTGKAAEVGNCISVHYRMSLADGTEVEGNNTFELGQPIALQLTQGAILEGWIQGVPGLKEGGMRRLTIPPELAYGDSDSPTIPANSTLIFDIELIKIES